MKDPATTVVITDTSDNASSNVREYKMYINDTYTISDTVQVIDPWNFKQTLTYKPDEGKGSYIVIKVYYDGYAWRQTLDWEGLHAIDYELSAENVYSTQNNRMDMASTSRYRHPLNEDVTYDQMIDLSYDVSDTDQTWLSTLSSGDGREFQQKLDLETGTWTQQYIVDDVLIWEDEWNMMENSLYNPYDTSNHHLKLATNETVNAESSGYSTGAIAGATVSLLALSFFTYAVVQRRRKVDEEQRTGINEPLLQQ